MNKVLAVVVTYNRINLLKRCIDAIQNQSCKEFDLLIVNNGSTDGTKEWIETLSDAIVINQENCGGAGGFYSGMKFGYEHGYDWIWMMDDDGIPQPDQLHYLLQYARQEQSILLNAIVCDVERPTVFAFNPSRSIENLPDILVNDEFRPFNGTFIHRQVIDKIGLIKREMFIWGDEMEYTFRAKKHNINPIVVTKAIHLHPRNKATIDKVLPPLIKWPIVVKPIKFSKYFYRNLGYNNRHYANRNVVIGNNISYIIYMIRKGRFSELFKFLSYYWRGYFNKF